MLVIFRNSNPSGSEKKNGHPDWLKMLTHYIWVPCEQRDVVKLLEAGDIRYLLYTKAKNNTSINYLYSFIFNDCIVLAMTIVDPE